MIKLWTLAIIAWDIVPYKSWSRILFGFQGFNFGDLCFLLITIPYFARYLRGVKKNRLNQWILLVWVACVVSVLKGLIFREDLREMFRVVRAELFWVLIPMMVGTLTTEDRLNSWFRGIGVLLIVASLTIVAFSYFPQLIPVDDEMGSLRGEVYGGFERTFTEGMWAVFAGAIIALASLLLNKKKRIISFLIFVIMIIGVVFTFVRTFFIGVIISPILIFLKARKEAIISLLCLAVAGCLIYKFIGFPEYVVKLLSAAFERMYGIGSIDFSDWDPTGIQGLATFMWRLTEIEVASAEFHTSLDKLTGLLGHIYSLQSGYYSSSMPHMGYFAIYYCHGWLGVIAYAGLLVTAMLRLWNNMRRRSDNLSWVPTAAFACWIFLLFGTISAPVFQFPSGVSVAAFTVGLSEAAARIINGKRGINQ